jgi:hypothetical protein
MAYAAARKEAARLLGGVTLETLDQQRAVRKQMEAEQASQAPAEEDLPWPDPVPDVRPVLDTALAELMRYIVLSKCLCATAVLWSAQVHLLPRIELGIDVAPRLAIQSAVKNSGKSTLLEGVANLTPGPLIAGAISAFAVFREIDQSQPTLLIDEADNVITKGTNPELLAILNSGHRRKTAFVSKSVPTPDGDYAPKRFRTFTGITFAGSKELPETLQDRSVIIRIRRKTRAEQCEHLRLADNHDRVSDARSKGRDVRRILWPIFT